MCVRERMCGGQRTTSIAKSSPSGWSSDTRLSHGTLLPTEPSPTPTPTPSFYMSAVDVHESPHLMLV